MPLSHDVLVTADSATENRVGHDAAFGGDTAAGQRDNQSDATQNAPAQQIADKFGGVLHHAGFMSNSKSIEQVAHASQNRDQNPKTIDPASQRLSEVGLKNGPIGQPAFDFR